MIRLAAVGSAIIIALSLILWNIGGELSKAKTTLKTARADLVIW